MKFQVELLSANHERSDFLCGNSLLDNYLHKQARQDVRRKLSSCFVLTDEAGNRVIGYYTLSNYGISLDLLPEEMRKKLPQSYRIIPVTLLGRLAVDTRYRGQNIGKHLLLDALFRSHQASKIIASFAVIVDPIDKDARSFYRKFDFTEFADNPKMFLPMSKIEKLFSSN